MAATITLSDVPDHIYDRLKRSAEAHNRSIAGEAIACLDRVLLPQRVSPDEHLAHAAAIRAQFGGRVFRIEDIDRAIDDGRA